MLGTRFGIITFALIIPAAALSAGSIGSGCAQEPPPFMPGSTTTSGAGGGGGTGGQSDLAEQMFRDLEADFVTACAPCHEVGGIADSPFLGDAETGDPEPYEAATSWPGIIVRDPPNSVLISWPASGSHTGGDTDAELEARLLAWLEEEAKAIADVDEGKPIIPPFKPIVPGFNAVYLDSLGAEYVGMAVTFQAEELTDMSLSMTTIQVHPTSKLGIEIEHPLFTVYAPGAADGDPDPIDSFSNVMQSVEPGMVAPLGPGTVVLTNWVPGGKLSLAFESVAVIDPMAGTGGAGGGDMGPCAALPAFEANAVAALNPCGNCHDGSNPTASNAVDMSDLGTDNSAACGQVLNRVDLNNPSSSQLFITTDPSGNAGHPFKFSGNQGNFDQFVQDMTQWINAEAQAQ